MFPYNKRLPQVTIKVSLSTAKGIPLLVTRVDKLSTLMFGVHERRTTVRDVPHNNLGQFSKAFSKLCNCNNRVNVQ